MLFSAGALIILIGGYLLVRTGDAIAMQTGIGSTLIGAVLVAIGTSLPEISTTAMAIRLGAHGMAISNIFGSNAFCLALLFVGDLAYREGPVLAATARSDLFLTGLGMLVTCAYLWGMLERRERTFLGMGIASFAVLLLYFGGLVVLYYLT
jgi:cation:H+ antiporter